jgi:transposase
MRCHACGYIWIAQHPDCEVLYCPVCGHRNAAGRLGPVDPALFGPVLPRNSPYEPD